MYQNSANMINNENYASCPYNPAHRVARSRLQHHIIKCEKTHPPLEICPFNATHRYPAHLMKAHYEVCPNKIEKEQNLSLRSNNSTVGAKQCPIQLMQKDYLPQHDPDNECWDD
ncbi:gametocyte-specific factor 1-like [Spodoptera litura]|uniref:Gametocyte-specific factor 1-like n=1 Tax=Spodoptera litura TaxID=69820 RepID=A0A9J7DVE9_SPOLT|nr:gametocyte-specific factor 1-like [Spodoptera litura]